MTAIVIGLVLVVVAAYIVVKSKQKKAETPGVNAARSNHHREGSLGNGENKSTPRTDGKSKSGTKVEGCGISAPQAGVKPRNLSGGVGQSQANGQRKERVVASKPYTVDSLPFLHDVFDIDYSKKLFFQYELTDSQGLRYPLMRVPQKGTAIKLPVHGRNGKRGFSERMLCNAISKYKLKGFYDNLSVMVKGVAFTPDLAYINVAKGIFIDIEVDEPYAGFEKLPTHYKVGNGTVDDRRNLSFTERGWIALRFSEKQIVEQCDSCLKYVYEVIRRMDTSVAVPNALVKAPALKGMEMWTLDEAKEYIRDRYREKMLGISEFICASSATAQMTLPDYVGGNEIETNLKRKEEERVWKRCQATGKAQDYLRLYPQGKFVDEAKTDIDKTLWTICQMHKEYRRYLNETKFGKFKAEAETLLQEQQRIEKQRRLAEQQRIREIQDREERQRREAQAEQRRREDEERKRREAINYERRQVSTNNPSTKTPSSRGYA